MNASEQELQSIDRRRFDKTAACQQRVWKVLTSSFFVA